MDQLAVQGADAVTVVLDDADLEAAEIIRLFMTIDLKQQYTHIRSGRALWERIRADFDAYQTAMASVIDKALRSIAPTPGETVAAFVARAQVMARQMKALGRPIHEDQLRDLILEGMERELPAWVTTVDALRVHLRKSSMAELTAELSRLENSKPELGPGVQTDYVGAFAARGPAPSQAPSTRAPPAIAVDALVQAVVAALSAQVPAHAAGSRPAPSAARAPLACYVCGGPHRARDCPNAFGRRGAPAPPMCMKASLLGPAPEWVLDSGSSQHMSPGGEGVFTNYRVLREPLVVHFGKRGSVAHAVGVGNVAVPGVASPVILPNVLHVPELLSPLFSVSRAVSDGVSVHFDPPAQRGGTHHVTLMHGGRVLLTASQRGGLYMLDVPLHAYAAGAESQATAVAWRWHRRLGHKGFGTLAELARQGVLGQCPTPAEFLQAREQRVCEPCVAGKMRRASHPLRVPSIVRPCFRLFADVCEFPAVATSRGGCRYFLVVVDEATRFSLVAPLARKSEAAAALRSAIAWLETQSGFRVVRVRTDRGGEFMARPLLAYYAERGIQAEFTPAYTPEANGVAERHNRVLLDMTRPMLADSGDARRGLAPLGPEHAVDAIMYANDVHLATPSAGALLGPTPHAALLGEPLNLGAFRRFGCRVWVPAPGKQFKHRDKLAPCGLAGRFLGFARPLSSGFYRVKLDRGGERVAQTLVFDDGVPPPPLALLPFPAAPCPPVTPPVLPSGGDDDEDADTGEAQASVQAEAQAPPAEAPVAAALDGEAPAAEAPAVEAPAAQLLEVGVPLQEALAGEPPAAAVAPAAERYPRRARHAPGFYRNERVIPPGALSATVVVPRPAGMPAGCPPTATQGVVSARVAQIEAALAAKAPEAPTGALPLEAAPERRSKRRCGGHRPRRRRLGQPRVDSVTFRPVRSGGPSRGTTARLRAMKGRSGMQPLWAQVNAREAAKPWNLLQSPTAAAAECAFCPVRPAVATEAGHRKVQSPGRWCDAARAGLQRVAMAARAAEPEFCMLAPRSVAEALSRPDAAMWQQAIDEEVASILQYGVWSECELPAGKQALPTHFVFEVKRDGRYKARLVAGGHRQQHGLDFEETYAPVCSYRTMRMLLAVAAHEDLELRQFDIRTAFLNGELEEEVYVRPPRGAEYLAPRGRSLRLWRALYGLRQAGRAWNKRLEAALRSRSFVQSAADPSLWIQHGSGGAVFSLFYVDDGLVAARTAAEADALVEMVASMFAIRALGEPLDFLGIRITRDRKARTITIDQEDKARRLVAAAGVTGERRHVPMSPEVYGRLRAAQAGEKLADLDEYQGAIGSLLHLAHCTRPDIALAVGALASFNARPTLAHRAALMDLIRYVGTTAERGIMYGRSHLPLGIWCDANFAACLDTRRSTTGWVVSMYGGAVSWSSKKQPTAAASTMDAEYQACGSVAREGLSLLKQLHELAYLSHDFPIAGPLTILCDNKAALTLCNERKEGQRVKHIDIIHHFARDHVQSGELRFAYCRSAENISDCLTKALARREFEANLLGLGMLHV